MEDKARQRIIQTASELFNQRGYRSVTLDDIAYSLGISKKTIYGCFEGKEGIAAAIIGEHSKKVMKRIEDIKGEDIDPIEKVIGIINAVKEMRSQINPQFLLDIQKYAPDLWENLESLRIERTMLMESLIRDAQEKRLVKKINPRMAVVFYVSVINYALRPDVMIKHGFTVEEVLDTLREIFLDGIRVR
ncbi:MAG: TetR/AcrR family transcriptional regulator [Firmicutes bacterium]|nr:TetR/AcrR family transcriptional regulator [Bacillota bacterium]